MIRETKPKKSAKSTAQSEHGKKAWANKSDAEKKEILQRLKRARKARGKQ
jgi:predicted Fe-S protein YdhL (DUF1289 family)